MKFDLYDKLNQSLFKSAMLHWLQQCFPKIASFSTIESLANQSYLEAIANARLFKKSSS